MKITIIGGGNVGTQFACVCAAKGYEVTVYTSQPKKFSGELIVFDKENNITCAGTIRRATASIEAAMDSADLVFITYPASMFTELSNMMKPYIELGQIIGVIPGTGGAEFAFADCVRSGAILFGLQRVPCIARLVEYGKSVCADGKRDKLHLASIPKPNAEELSSFMSDLFDMPCDVLPNYLCVTMTPSNPILHTTRLCTMFSDYYSGKVYDRNPLFYGEWSDASSELLLACDEEHQRLLRAMPELDLTSVKSLRIHYESDNAQQLTAKLKSIKSLNSITSPMKLMDNGWIPDFNSRYFTADFPYGLSIIEELSRIVGVDVPNINKCMNWYINITGDNRHFDIKAQGINNITDIVNLYN